MPVYGAPWLFLISLGASALGGALGMASGIFIVPLLTLVAGMDIHLAIGAAKGNQWHDTVVRPDPVNTFRRPGPASQKVMDGRYTPAGSL